jgi:hypothetical protein
MLTRAEMRKAFSAGTLVLALLFSAIAGTFLINLSCADPYMYQEYVSPPAGATPLIVFVSSPKNNAIYTVDEVNIAFNITTHGTSIYYLLGAYFEADWMQDNVTVYKQNTYSPEFPEFWDYKQTFQNVSDGNHTIVITAWGGGGYAKGLTWCYYDMTTVSVVNFTIDATPLKVSILSVENKTYDSSDIPLNFTLSKKTSLIAYSIDGQDNRTVYGNTTLTGLPNGAHNLTVYAWDASGKVGSSETVTFIIAKPKPPEPFPTAPVATVSGTLAVIVAAAVLLVYFKKRKRGQKP